MSKWTIYQPSGKQEKIEIPAAITNAVVNFFAEEARKQLEEDPDAMTICCRCGNTCRLDEVNEHGNCC